MKQTNLLSKTRDFIEQEELLVAEGKYLVALSGGADSVALLLILQGLGYTIEACHCNFQLRGEESDRDEQFCVKLCQRLNIPLHRIHFDTHTYAKAHKVSIEMAARELRYKYFHDLEKDIKADGICVAHHQDDDVETVLINLIRGTGIAGLKGIAAKNGTILRPLLCVNRQEILEYLKEKEQDFVTDSTNLVDDVVRNKIRLNIIPLMKEINPAVCQNIAKTAHYLKEADETLVNFIHNAKQDYDEGLGYSARDSFGGIISISKEQLRWHQPSLELSLFDELNQYGFTGKVIQEIANSFAETGKTWSSRTHHILLDYRCLYIERIDNRKPFKPLRIPETGLYTLPPKSIYLPIDNTKMGERDEEDIKRELKVKNMQAMQTMGLQTSELIDKDLRRKEVSDFSKRKNRTTRQYDEYMSNEQKIRVSIHDKNADFEPSKLPYCITLDAEKIKFPLTVRTWKYGDVMEPFGMKGKKLVSDILNEARENSWMKEYQPVIEDAMGNIIWVVGIRNANLGKVTQETTKILEIKLEFE